MLGPGIAAAIGIACGWGQYRVVVVGAVLAVVLVVAFRVIERYIPDARGEKND
jgi:uncharacterized membrane protein YhiD involved in acid resistance